MGSTRIDREAFEVGFKGWDWSMGSMQDPWYAGFHPRAARTRAKRAFLTSILYKKTIGLAKILDKSLHRANKSFEK